MKSFFFLTPGALCLSDEKAELRRKPAGDVPAFPLRRKSEISREDVLSKGVVLEEDYVVLEKYTRALFQRGTEIAASRGLILVLLHPTLAIQIMPPHVSHLTHQRRPDVITSSPIPAGLPW